MTTEKWKPITGFPGCISEKTVKDFIAARTTERPRRSLPDPPQQRRRRPPETTTAALMPEDGRHLDRCEGAITLNDLMSSPTERWLPIPDFPGYLVSDQGRVASDMRRKRRVLSPYATREGYWQVLLYRAGRRPHVSVHRLVLSAFVGPCPEGMEGRHLNGDQNDNSLRNLAYGTKSRNILDQVSHGTHAEAKKTHCPRNHPYDASNTYYSPTGRKCRTCRRSRQTSAPAINAQVSA